MPDPSLLNQNTGIGSTATVTASFGFTATAGSLLLLAVGADDYKTGNPSGWSAATAELQTFLGHNLWYKYAAGGETSVQYSIGSATGSAWCVAELGPIDPSPFDTASGQLAQSSGTTYTTPSITPGAGRKLVIASIGGTDSSAFTGELTTWLNSFTEINDVGTTAPATKDIVGLAYRVMDGGSSISSGATYGGNTASSRTGIIASFIALADSTYVRPTIVVATQAAINRASRW